MRQSVAGRTLGSPGLKYNASFVFLQVKRQIEIIIIKTFTLYKRLPSDICTIYCRLKRIKGFLSKARRSLEILGCATKKSSEKRKSDEKVKSANTDRSWKNIPEKLLELKLDLSEVDLYYSEKYCFSNKLQNFFARTNIKRNVTTRI